MIYPKISKIINCQLTQFCLTEPLLTVYNSRTLPCLQYCSIIWPGSLLALFTYPPLLGLQIRAIQTIIKSLLCAHSYPHSSYNQFYKHQVSCFVFNHAEKLQPITLSFLFHFYLKFSQVLYQAKEQPSHLFSQNNLPVSG